ncbi:hypothetical protein IHE45_01G048800 [Dioscorea alata]|uniref:Uncharacterized protein n=1 Tax=Dioscorea alata TaxID=55571 RepID=A0ACB7WTP3_DIOAL|nr:hypothetical protein IHE45_01G048800 [Dioscorea alata]
MHSTNQLSTWEVFVHQLELRLDLSSFINHKAQLYKLRQHSTITEYLSEFECLSTRITNLSHENLLNCLFFGFQEDIQLVLYLLKPCSLHDVMGMAKLVEDKCNAVNNKALLPINSVPLPSAPNQNRNSPSLSTRRMPPAEMVAYREKGLDYNCDDHFTPRLHCKPPQFLYLLTETDNEAPSQDVSMEISPLDNISGVT